MCVEREGGIVGYCVWRSVRYGRRVVERTRPREKPNRLPRVISALEISMQLAPRPLPPLLVSVALQLLGSPFRYETTHNSSFSAPLRIVARSSQDGTHSMNSADVEPASEGSSLSAHTPVASPSSLDLGSGAFRSLFPRMNRIHSQSAPETFLASQHAEYSPYCRGPSKASYPRSIHTYNTSAPIPTQSIAYCTPAVFL